MWSNHVKNLVQPLSTRYLWSCEGGMWERRGGAGHVWGGLKEENKRLMGQTHWFRITRPPKNTSRDFWHDKHINTPPQ